ncbi:DUF72 domain-containing protein [Vibrio viridaestus]|uniref:DUF72 domain-containing protein n=1 Tax=Vibrio viridaestus TaxID=2487322 RepID=A0A3N9TD14_9VIBR|nr:DUF72 domain-containing protein [Vibrio viridaestus]RQW61940.1 DUF72 domain-containing protein [Vibrio viridaestus]
MTNAPLKMGLTMWSHAPWQESLFGAGTKSTDRLHKYAHYFNTVEGNTTFYATPSLATVQNWNNATPDDFRFTFKLPKGVTHEGNLIHKKAQLYDFLSIMDPLNDKIGLWTIQLPASFSPEMLNELKSLISFFPKHAPLAIEVRHPGFFDKGESEKQFNRWLIEKKIDRIIMDSRPIFSVPAINNAVLTDAQQKKPKVPVHAISTSDNPMVRFIGLPTPEDNQTFVLPWVAKIAEWISAGKTPYLMIHTADNDFAPELAISFYKQLSDQLPLPALPELLNSQKDAQIKMF